MSQLLFGNQFFIHVCSPFLVVDLILAGFGVYTNYFTDSFSASSRYGRTRLLSSAINWGGLIYDARQDIDLFLRTTCNAFLTFFAYITTELNKYA